MGFLKNIIIDAILFVALAGLFANTGWFYVTSVWTALVAAIVLTASFVGPGIHFSSFWAAMLIALIMSICNTIISNHFANQ